jgi:hypothetical protein
MPPKQSLLERRQITITPVDTQQQLPPPQDQRTLQSFMKPLPPKPEPRTRRNSNDDAPISTLTRQLTRNPEYDTGRNTGQGRKKRQNLQALPIPQEKTLLLYDDNYALHTIEISNKIPLEEAKKKAQEFIKDKKKKYYRETKNFYRFRNISKQKFEPKSFKSKKINDDIILVFGNLKDEWKQLKGGGIIDVLKNPIGTLKEAFAGIPTKYNNVSRNTLEKHNEKILSLRIARTPLNPALGGLLNTMSLGKWNELQKKHGFDKLFHLSLIANNNVIIEKNETITIELLNKSKSIKPNTEFLDVNVNKDMTLISMMDTTQKYMGDNKFFDYDAFNNNCQFFIKAILDSNGLSTDATNKFLFQDLSGMKQDLDNSKFSFIPKVMRKITDLGSIVSRLSGKGNKQKALKAFEEYTKRHNITHHDVEAITEDFINFINQEGIKFI